MMRVKELTFTFSAMEYPVLENVSFSIPAGKITCIIGPNGSGKSTLFRCLTGQYRPQKGEVLLNGRPLSSFSGRERAKRLAIVHQHHPAIHGITVRELIETGRTPYKPTRKTRSSEEQFLKQIMEWTDVTPLQNQFIDKLSGGQRQRVWLAQALSQDPDILLLDEPNTYLDMQYQVELIQLLKFLNKKEGLTLCLILHDLTQVMEIADNVVAIFEGKVFAKGKPEEVLTEENIEKLFGVKSELIRTHSGNTVIHYLGYTNGIKENRFYKMSFK